MVASSLWKVIRAKTVQLQEHRAVGRRGVAPQGVDRGRVRVVAELEGPVQVRVHVVADHLALGGVGVGVTTEQRGDDQDGQRPQGEHAHHGLEGHATAAAVETGHAPPDAHEQEEPAVDGGQREVDAPAAGRGRRGLAEEPDAGHLELEGRARHGGTDGDGQDGHEAEQGRAEDQAPGVRHLVDVLGRHRRRRTCRPGGRARPRRGGAATRARPRPVAGGGPPGGRSSGTAAAVRSGAMGSRVSWVVSVGRAPEVRSGGAAHGGGPRPPTVRRWHPSDAERNHSVTSL